MFTRNKSRVGSSCDTVEQKYSPEKCRVCLDVGEIPIFGVNDISENVTEFGKIQVEKDDNLPQYLCAACSALLEAAILFRKTAKETDEVLRKRYILDSCSEESDSKHESEPYIKREYLELNYTSESELDDVDNIKLECKSEDESTIYNPTISESDMLETNDNKDFHTNSLDVKEEVDDTNNSADQEMIMIIVSEKDNHKSSQLECDKCCIAFDTVEQLTQHNVKTHMNPQTTTTCTTSQRECEICHVVVKTSFYREHLKEHRQKYKQKCDKRYSKIECEICGKLISKSYHKHHMRMHGTPEEIAEASIECPICKKMFSSRYFNDHYRRVHDKKQLKNIQNMIVQEPVKSPKFHTCPVCDKEIKDSEYKLHLERHGGPLKRYICDKCGKVFKHPSAFKTHCLTHGSELKYKCQFCPYRGLHQGLLKIHVRTHTGDYNYKCTECPARFITKSNLSKHLLRHKGHCNFNCDVCGKGFYTKRDVEKHSRNVHLTVKNHICEVCGKGFGHRDNMLSHQLKVHKRDKIISRGRMPSYLKAEQKHLVG